MDKDLIVGVVDNYNWDKIKYWANSIKKSGFEGYKALIVYNMDAATVKKLTEEDFMLIGCTQYDAQTGFRPDNSRGNVMVDRFFHISSFLSMLEKPMDVDRVVMTDVRDVVFQSNPTEWLDTYFLNNTQLLVGSENMTYGSEPWGRNNLKHAFGEYFLESAKVKEIYCAGVIAGTRMALKDFALNLWLICRGLNPQVPGGGGPDQAAMNIALGMEAYKEALEEGIAPEQARLLLPAYGMYVRWRWTTSLQGVLTFLDQRLEHDARAEIQQYAFAVKDLAHQAFPHTFKELYND